MHVVMLCKRPEPNPLVAKITFQQWLACLPRWILRTRAKFAALLARSFAILRRSEETATTLFPLPLPCLECFRSSGPNLSKKRHLSVCRARLLNIWVLLLCLGRIPSFDELRRCPSSQQLAVFARSRTFMSVCVCGTPRRISLSAPADPVLN